MDCRNGLCTAEAGRCLLRTLPRKPQVPYAAGPWAGKTAFEIPILGAGCRALHVQQLQRAAADDAVAGVVELQAAAEPAAGELPETAALYPHQAVAVGEQAAAGLVVVAYFSP